MIFHLESTNSRVCFGFNTINISFFGASVTDQKEGYVKHFADRNSFNINKYGYGSMHIRDAGMAFIDEVLKSKPQYCFIDWFSTSYIPQKAELQAYLDNFRYKFISQDCNIIFLLLSGSNSHMSSERIEMYNRVIDYSRTHMIPYINVHNYVKDNGTDLLRDEVHTSDLGGEVYGNYIYNQFYNHILGKYTLNKNKLRKNAFADIKRLVLGEFNVEEHITIKGKCKIIGIYQKVGPYSGIVKINSDGKISEKSLWDRWCYYERKVMQVNNQFDRELKITLLQKEFDTSAAKLQVNWHAKKLIKPIEVYYIGHINSLELK